MAAAWDERLGRWVAAGLLDPAAADRIRAWESQQAQESGTRVVVGVNRFTDDAPPPDLQTPDYSALATRQRERLAAGRG